VAAPKASVSALPRRLVRRAGRVRGRVAVLGAALLLGGCARLLPGGLRCPDRGGAAWREYRSDHFLVYSDLDREHAAGIVQELESVRAMELAVMAEEGQEIAGRVRVVAPAEGRMFRAIAPPGVLGYSIVSGLGEPTIVLHAGSIRRDPEVLAHELAHSLSWHLYVRQPQWFTEGLAHFVQTVASTDPSRRGLAGRVPRIREARCTRDPPVPAKELLVWRRGLLPEEIMARQLWSWVLYHWLWSEHPRELEAYQRRLGAGEDPVTAWATTFPELDPATRELGALDEALRRHCARGDLPFRRASATAGTSFTEAPLTSAAVHVLLVEARGYWELRRRRIPEDEAPEALEEAARPDLEEALEEDPLQPRALSRVADLEGRPAGPPLRRACAGRPGDWSAWFLLGDALEDEGDLEGAEAAYRRAATLNADNAPTHNNLAWLLGNAARAAEALPFAERAARLAPWDPAVLDTLALVLDGQGACPAALRLQRRAVDLLGAGGALNVMKGGDPAELRERLAGYEARCGEARATGPAR
jgi:tetratricopeptide (TPR) repeat protein